MHFNESFLQSIFTEEEFLEFLNIIRTISIQSDSVCGVLAVGSLAQKILQQDCENIPKDKTDKHVAYEKIRNRKRRKQFPCRSSDLDLWICTKDTPGSEHIKREISERSIELIKWLTNNPDLHGTDEWCKRKIQAFGPYYKQTSLYSPGWIEQNGNTPWNASGFKNELEKQVMQKLPEVVCRVNSSFDKGIPGGFFEIRAYPQSVFNLRPEEIMIDGHENRSPFPRIIDSDWLSIMHNTHILYSMNLEKCELIYPFNPDGERLGYKLLNYLNSKKND